MLTVAKSWRCSAALTGLNRDAPLSSLTPADEEVSAELAAACALPRKKASKAAKGRPRLRNCSMSRAGPGPSSCPSPVCT